VLGRPAVRPGQPRRLRQTHHAVAADAPDQLGREAAQDPGEAGDVIAGVGHDEDVRLAGLPLARGDEPVDDIAELGSGDRGGIGGRAEPNSVQDVAPVSSTATNEYGRPGMNCEAVIARP
jgi:hypothetical protein